MRPPLIRLFEDEAIIDGFAGGGGTSTGIEMVLGRSPDVAINHDAVALAMHEANHPTTHHVQSNIRHVKYETLLAPGTRCGLAWFSPDCTHHSKARGGKPFRDRQRARRIRGLAWEAVRCAKALGPRAPRIIVLENVEEWRDWCPLLEDGTPDWSRKGANYRRWKRELAKAGPGYVIEDRELVACDHGAPTARKRLFVIARSDGQPIVWPEPTHGPGRPFPYRTAAECIDFGLPVPSIFLTPKQAKAWGKVHNTPAPKRPLATATKRRIARGVMRFVVNSPEPFIVPRVADEAIDMTQVPPGVTVWTGPLVAPVIARIGQTGGNGDYVNDIRKPLTTVTTKAEHLLVAPTLVRIAHGERDSSGKKRGKGEHAVDAPLPTQTGSNEFALVTPFLASVRHHDESHLHPVTEPIRTIPASDREFALVAPVLVNNSETRGDRAYRSDEPIRTLTAAGCRTYQLVAAFLAKHNAGHEATGQKLQRPIDTVTTKDSKAIVTSHLLKLRGGVENHPNTSQDLRAPAPTITAGGTHYAEVRAFLVKYFGTKKDGQPVDAPVGALTTRERYGLVTVTIAGEEYAIVDIGMRMLTPRELFLCQGFPASYEIHDVPLKTPLGIASKQRLTKKAQTRLVGNSVPPHVAAAIVRANLGQAVGSS